MIIQVYEGVYTEGDGTRIGCIIEVDGAKIGRWFSKSAHNDAAFAKAKKGKRVVSERLMGGVIVTLFPTGDNMQEAQ